MTSDRPMAPGPFGEPQPAHHLAVLLVDVNNSFFDPRGEFHYPDALAIVPALRQLLDAARAGGRLVVFAREGHWPGLADHEGRKLPSHTYAGSFDAAPFPGFEARAGEPEIRKRRYSAFFGTELALLLAEQGVRELVIAGVKTNVCIRATAQDAFANGIRPILVRGTVNSNRPHLHEASLEDVERYFGEVIDLDQAVRRLSGEPGADR
jgi:maleamate amidohydrolase